jgi:SAM-dependent methyltransferase
MKIFLRKCPVCSGKTGAVLHHQKFQLSDTSILPDQYDVVCCQICGFVFADTSVGQDVYNTYYAEYSKYEDADSSISTGGGTSVWDKERLKRVSNDISAKFKKDISILDIGCANGGLLFELKKEGFANVFGLDPSRACVNYVNNAGVTCYLGELFEADRYLQGKKFDLLILSHVFEHIYDLKNATMILRNLLNDNGAVYVEVPDASHYGSYYVVPYYYFDSEHINHFDGHALKNLFESFGFSQLITQDKFFMVNDTTKYPAVYSIFRKTPSVTAASVIKSEVVRNEVLKYLEMSGQNAAHSELQKLADSKEPIVVFGAGNFTARLLESTPLKQCNIVAYVDNDKKKQGITFNNTKVMAPEYIKQFRGRVVVCSALHHDQIVEQVKANLMAKNDLLIIK